MMTFRYASVGTSSLNRVAATPGCSCLSPLGSRDASPGIARPVVGSVSVR